MTIRKWSSPSISELFKDYNDGVDHWNSVVNNELDRLTSYYEESTKRVKGKLLKKEVIKYVLYIWNADLNTFCYFEQVDYQQSKVIIGLNV